MAGRSFASIQSSTALVRSHAASQDRTPDTNRCASSSKAEGGGLYLKYVKDATIANSSFSGNEASDGGAIFIWPKDSPVTMEKNTFSENEPNDIGPK